MKTEIEKNMLCYVNEPQKVQKLALIYSHSHPTGRLIYYVENGLKMSFFLKDYRTFIFSFPPDYKCWKNNLSYGILGTQFPFPEINWKYRVYVCLIPICQLNSSKIKSIVQFLRLFISYMLDHGLLGTPFIR